MHKMVAFIFKLIGISIMAMIIFDTSLMLVDAFTTNDRIQAQALLIQQEVARNNYLSDGAREVFEGKKSTEVSEGQGYGFAHIEELSNVYVSIKFNGDEDFQGGEIKSLSTIKDYGDFHTLVIKAEINPWHYFFSGVVNNGTGIREVRSAGIINYVYYIPCLRYIK